MNEVSIDDLITLICAHQGVSSKTKITIETRLEEDLGITGDDGCELLEEIQRRFSVSFAGADGSLRAAFQLEKDEYLFHSEGTGLFRLFAKLLGHDIEKVRPLTVGQLHQAILAARLG